MISGIQLVNNKSRAITILLLLLQVSVSVCAQMPPMEYSDFLVILEEELAHCNIGKYDEHYKDGYIVILSESDYFNSNERVDIETIYEMGKYYHAYGSLLEIRTYFDQYKELKTQQKIKHEKAYSYEAVKSLLKIRLYPDKFKSIYEEHDAIVRADYDGMIEVIVLDLPDGIGILDRKYLASWQKPEETVYNQAKTNTVNVLTTKFTKLNESKDGFYVLQNDQDLFTASWILDLKKCNIPYGKYGALVSAPNSTTIIAKTLDDKKAAVFDCLSMIATTLSYWETPENIKPVSGNVFWYYNNALKAIDMDFINETCFPPELQKLIK